MSLSETSSSPSSPSSSAGLHLPSELSRLRFLEVLIHARCRYFLFGELILEDTERYNLPRLCLLSGSTLPLVFASTPRDELAPMRDTALLAVIAWKETVALNVVRY
mgnify:CR=1 FL=1